jgi:hypothetical protein
VVFRGSGLFVSEAHRGTLEQEHPFTLPLKNQRVQGKRLDRSHGSAWDDKGSTSVCRNFSLPVLKHTQADNAEPDVLCARFGLPHGVQQCTFKRTCRLAMTMGFRSELRRAFGGLRTAGREVKFLDPCVTN